MSARCETCGYSLESLEPEESCPECGRVVSTSLPEARRGSPWQRRPGLFSFIWTHWLALVSPTELFRRVRMDASSWKLLLAMNLLVAAFLVVDPWVGVFIGDPTRGLHWAPLAVQAAARGLGLIVQTALGAVVLLGVTMVVRAGMRVWGAMGEGGMAAQVSWQVVAHASTAWVMCGIFSLLGMAVRYGLLNFGGETWRRFFGRITHAGGMLRSPMSIGELTLIAVILAGYIAGLAILAWRMRVGYAACRFAGPVESRALGESQLAR